MDQVTEQIDAYAEHVKKVRARVEEEEIQRQAKAVTCHVVLNQDEVEGLLGIIENHIATYKVTSQALLMRAATKLRDSLYLG